MRVTAIWILTLLVTLSTAPLAVAQSDAPPPVREEAVTDRGLGFDQADTEPPPRRRPRGRGPAAPVEESAPKERKEKKKKDVPDEWLLIKGADVHTVTDGVYTGTSILVKNGVIHEIGNAIEAPEKTEVIDAAGMRVYPGLVSMTSRGIVGRPPVEDTTDPFSLNMVLALSSGVTTVLSSNAAAKLTYGSVDNMTIAENPWIQLQYSSRSPSGKRNLRRDLDKVRDYLKEKRIYDRKKKRGDEDAEEPDGKFLKGKFDGYKKLITGEALGYFSRMNSAGDMLAVCQLCRDYGIKAIVAGGTEAWTIAPALGRADVRMILTPRNKQGEDARTNRPTGHSIENARILRDHGVTFAISVPSGSISLGGQTGRDLLNVPMSAAFAMRGGLDARTALESITIEPARLLGVDDQIGSIEEGKDADLIICDGDILHYETMVQWTVVNGKVVYDKEKESLFSHIRPRSGEAEEVDNIWPKRWIEKMLKGTGPGATEGGDGK